MSSATSSPMNKYGIPNFDEENDALLRMTWWLENFSGRNYTLLTSDHPVIISPLNKPSTVKHPRIKDRFFAPSRLLSIPLSPTVCLYAYINGKIKFTDKNRLLKTTNLITLTTAKKFIYAANRDQRSFVEKNLLKNPALKKYYDQQVDSIRKREFTRKTKVAARSDLEESET